MSISLNLTQLPEINLEIPEIFAEFFQPARYKIAYGGRGSGKSMAFARMLLLEAVAKPLRILCTRELQTSIKDSVHKILADEIYAMGLQDYFTIQANTITSICGSEFIFKGLRHNANEIKSMQGIDRCWCEEAQSISKESWMILTPTIRANGSELWLCFNPDSITDFTYDFVLNPRPRSIIKKVNYTDNPFFPEELREEMVHMRKVDYDAYLNVWEGQPKTASNSLIFKDKYVVDTFETPENVDRFYFGADWGFSEDPSTVVRCYLDGRTLYIDQEAWGLHVETVDQPAFIQKVPGWNRWPIRADSARPETISHCQRNGIPNMEAVKKIGESIKEGISYLRGLDKIVIHPRCKKTIEEFSLYSYKVDKQSGDISTDIIDKHNHCIAKGQLIDTARGLVAIEDVVIGDQVLTRSGYRSVLWSGATDRDREVVNVISEDGEVLKLTPDHRIYTERGFTSVDALRYGDSILTTKRGGIWQKGLRLFTKGLFMCAGLMQSSGRIAFISNLLSSKPQPEKPLTFTGKSGKTLLAIYQKASTFTTKMETLSTTILTTWNACLSRITSPNTPGPRIESKDSSNTSKTSGPSPLPGMEAKKGLNGIESKPSISTSTSHSLRIANAAERDFLIDQVIGPQNFAATNAGQKQEEIRESTTSKSIVDFAAPSLNVVVSQIPSVVPSRVLAVLRAEEIESEVYDLTIESDPEFFANGVLVHNCIDALRYALQPLISAKHTIRTAKISGF